MFIKRILIVIVLCLLIAPFTAGTVKAQEPDPGPCYIHLFDPSDLTLHQSDCSTFIFGTIDWTAFSPGLITAWLHDVGVTFSVQGPNGYYLAMDEEETAMLWSPISEVPTLKYGITCPNKENIWDTVWMKDAGYLDVGVYQIHAVLVLNHELHDGLQQCSYLDGTPVGNNHYGPWNWVLERTVTIEP